MSQSTDLSISNQSRTAYRAEHNQIISAIASSHKGASAPSYAIAGLTWLDDSGTPWVLKLYDGADWIVQGKYNASTNKFYLSGQADAIELDGVPTVKQLQNNAVTYTATGGAANVQTLDLGSGLRPSAYAAGQEFRVAWGYTNTGAATLNVTGSGGTGLGAKSIKMPDGSDPIAGTLTAGQQGTVRYDGTNMVLISAPPFITQAQLSAANGGLAKYAADTGAANAYAVAPAPAITAYAVGQAFVLKPANANTGACTLAVNGLTAKDIKLTDGSNPPANAMLATGTYLLIYDGTNLQLINPTVSAFPIGTTIEFSGDTLPADCLEENGAAVSRTTYAALFAAIGVLHGAGDGSTTFNLPDSRRRVAVGRGGTGTGVLGNAVGNTGGAEAITLTILQMPVHDHDFDMLNNSFSTSGKPVGGLASASTGTTHTRGGGQAHDNIQPSIVKMKCIKYQ